MAVLFHQDLASLFPGCATPPALEASQVTNPDAGMASPGSNHFYTPGSAIPSLPGGTPPSRQPLSRTGAASYPHSPSSSSILPRQNSTSSIGSHPSQRSSAARTGPAALGSVKLTRRPSSQAGSSPSSPMSGAARAAAEGRLESVHGGSPRAAAAAPRRRTAPEAPTTGVSLWQRLEQWSSGAPKGSLKGSKGTPKGPSEGPPKPPGQLRRLGSRGGSSSKASGAAAAGHGGGVPLPPTPRSADALGRGGRAGTSPVANEGFGGAVSARDWAAPPSASVSAGHGQGLAGGPAAGVLGEGSEIGVGEFAGEVGGEGALPAGDAASGVGSRSVSNVSEWLESASEASGRPPRERKSAQKGARGSRGSTGSQKSLNVVDVMEKLWQF